jgi:hypothetical protein
MPNGFSHTILWKIRRAACVIMGSRAPTNVNISKGYIFVHIPKTAGTSMCEALGLPETTHDTAVDLKRTLGARYDELYRFAFVRNPWDRHFGGRDHSQDQDESADFLSMEAAARTARPTACRE